MAKKRPKTAMYFNEIAAVDTDYAYVTGHLYGFAETEDDFTRLMRIQGRNWAHLGDLDEIIWSLCAYAENDDKRVLIAMGQDGEATIYAGTDIRAAPISMQPSKIFQVARIGEEVYACGSLYQVFQFANGGWSLHSASITRARARGQHPAFFGIHGTSANDIFCVGRQGVIAHYDGSRYQFLDSPTNRHLERVLCSSNGDVVICGRDGAIFRGNIDQWSDINDVGCTHHFWGIAEFRERIYVCTDSELFIVDGSGLIPVDFDLEGETSLYRLASNTDYLLATSGKDDVYRFDGVQWERLICPDNA